MFALETAKLDDAIEKAKQLHPKVKMACFGEYQVTGSTGNDYTIRCYRSAAGLKIVDCSCQTKDGVTCQHGLAAASLHIAVARQRGH